MRGRSSLCSGLPPAEGHRRVAGSCVDRSAGHNRPRSVCGPGPAVSVLNGVGTVAVEGVNGVVAVGCGHDVGCRAPSQRERVDSSD